MIVVASWSVSRARLEEDDFSRRKAYPNFSLRRPFHKIVVESQGRAGGGTDEKAIASGGRTARETENASKSYALSLGETTLRQIASRLDTFEEEIARTTDTSCARSSYPQHPAVAAAAAVAVEGDKAEHARNSVPPRAPRAAATQPPIHFLSTSSSSRPTRFSSPRSTFAASTLRSLFCAEITLFSREFNLTLHLLVFILYPLFGKWNSLTVEVIFLYLRNANTKF